MVNIQTLVRGRASAARRVLLRISPVSETPYATHQPVLIALSGLISPNAVAEFGSGNYSTRLFLDRSCFPTVAGLDTWDNDPRWAAMVLAETGGDHRLRMHVVDMVADHVPDLAPFDLVFIDDSMTYPERAQTVAAVGRRVVSESVVVLHDYEHRIYRRAARVFDHRYTFRAFTPQVLVAWSGSRLKRNELRSLDSKIKAGRHIPVTDAEAWQRHLSRAEAGSVQAHES